MAQRRAVSAATKPKTPRATPQYRLPADARRAHIVAVARKVFLEAGLSGARTKQIAEAVGVAEGLLYRYFDSKETLFEAAVLEPVERLISELATMGERFATLDSAGRSSQSESFHREFLKAMIEIVPLLGVALYSDREFGKRFYRQRLQPLLDKFEEAMETSLAGWPHTQVEPGFLCAVALGTHSWFAQKATFGSGRIDTDAVAQQITELFVHIMGAPAVPRSRRKPAAG